MILPDHHCEKHFILKSRSMGRDGYYRYYCNACRREKASSFHYGGPSCRRGHLKTPWTWRLNRTLGAYRCMTCESLMRKKRKARKAA